MILISWEAAVRALAASFLGSDPPFPSRATFTSIYLYQRKRTTRKRRGTSLSKGKPSRQKYKGRESQSSGPAGCLVHAVPGAATAASEYKLLKVSEYEAKLLKVRGSERDMDQRHVLYTQMPWSLMHCFKVQGKALRQRSVSKFKDARVSIERYCQRCEGESSFGIQNVQCALFITAVVPSSILHKKNVHTKKIELWLEPWSAPYTA